MYSYSGLERSTRVWSDEPTCPFWSNRFSVSKLPLCKPESTTSTRANPSFSTFSKLPHHSRLRCLPNKERRRSPGGRTQRPNRLHKPRPAGVSTEVLIQYFRPELDRIVFMLPVELLLEIFSYYDDHRHFIHGTRSTKSTSPCMDLGHVERSTIIRKLTMTCWALRNTLLPVLWRNVEGCTVRSNSHGGYTYGLYAQCLYILSNPAIAPYVQCVGYHRASPQHSSRDVAPQGLFCGPGLPRCPERPDEEVRRHSGSVAKPKDTGAVECQPQEPCHGGTQTQIRSVPKHPRDGYPGKVP